MESLSSRLEREPGTQWHSITYLTMRGTRVKVCWVPTLFPELSYTHWSQNPKPQTEKTQKSEYRVTQQRLVQSLERVMTNHRNMPERHIAEDKNAGQNVCWRTRKDTQPHLQPDNHTLSVTYLALSKCRAKLLQDSKTPRGTEKHKWPRSRTRTEKVTKPLLAREEPSLCLGRDPRLTCTSIVHV